MAQSRSHPDDKDSGRTRSSTPDTKGKANTKEGKDMVIDGYSKTDTGLEAKLDKDELSAQGVTDALVRAQRHATVQKQMIDRAYMLDRIDYEQLPVAECATCLTDVGRAGRGYVAEKEFERSIVLLHDLLERAGDLKNIELDYLCGTLRQVVFTDYYSTVSGEDSKAKTFADALRRIIQKGGNVRILVWNEAQKGLIDPNITALMREIAKGKDDHPEWGSIAVRISGTTRGSENKICHFALVRSKEEMMYFLENPHRPHLIQESIADSPDVPSQLGLGTKEAVASVRELTPVFEQFYNLAGSRAASGDRTGYYSAAEL